MTLTPTQTLLARAAAERLRGLRELHALAGVAPMAGETISVPIEEMECLCAAAAPALGMEAEDCDLGAWHAPGPSRPARIVVTPGDPPAYPGDPYAGDAAWHHPS